ncbi:MAG: hypothetical protein K8T91_25720 [Planctomycetes bacterium]|nr:hypothetical protein [Planctomycetota bacterium]
MPTLSQTLKSRIEAQGIGRVAAAAGMTPLLLIIGIERSLEASDDQVASLQAAVERLEAEAN